MIINEDKLIGCDQRVIDLSKYLDSELSISPLTNLIASSGKRSKAHNEKIGGSPRSYHLLGTAIDFHFENVNVFKVVTELYYLVQRQEGVFKGVTEFEVCRAKNGMQHFHIAFGERAPRYFTGTYK